jgi:hypothetical protein
MLSTGDFRVRDIKKYTKISDKMDNNKKILRFILNYMYYVAEISFIPYRLGSHFLHCVE